MMEADDVEKRRQAICDAVALARERTERYEAKYGPDIRLTCPICGTEDMGRGAKFRLYLTPGKTISDMEGVIPDTGDSKISTMTHRCVNGHRWRMKGENIEGVVVWDTWMRL